MKSIVLTSAAALMLAAGLAAPVMAQTASMTINGAAVSESDLPYVQKRCNELGLEANVLPSQGDQNPNDTQEDDADDGDNAITSVDLDSLTVEQCEDGGFYGEMNGAAAAAPAPMMQMTSEEMKSDMTINGAAVSESDLPYLMKRCEELGIEANVLPSQSDQNPNDTQDDDADEGDNALTSIDLDTLTVEQCKDGGFYTAM